MANGNGNGKSQDCQTFWPTWHSNKAFTLVLLILLGYLIVWLGSMIWLNSLRVERVGRSDTQPGTILIEGMGKVTGTPNIATATLGLQVTKADVPTAQRENSEKMNAFIGEVKKLGIDSADIQTADYSIYPQYRYDPNSGRSEIDQYTVSQNVMVKIRDLTKISAVLGKAGEAGLNQVSGISFTIDDPETLKAEARTKALEQAKEKAVALEQGLGVSLGRVIGFSESSGGGVAPYAARYYDTGMGLGGGAAAPSVESGTLDVVVNVSLTYEIQ